MTSSSPLVVIIEDDEFAAFLFRQVLVANGYTVVINSGTEADRPALLALQPAALLVDLHLEESDGLALLEQLRAVRSLRHVPAAVITGDYFTDARVSRRLEALGVELHLKPLWDDELLRVVGSLVKRPPHRMPLFDDDVNEDATGGRAAHP